MTTNCAHVLALSCPTREPAATPLPSCSKPLAHCERVQEDRRGQQWLQFVNDNDATTLSSHMLSNAYQYYSMSMRKVVEQTCTQ